MILQQKQLRQSAHFYLFQLPNPAWNEKDKEMFFDDVSLLLFQGEITRRITFSSVHYTQKSLEDWFQLQLL